MKVLSLFDGMACGMLAMQAAGIKIDKYTAFEVDKYAIETATHNFPIIEERGDVFNADFTEFKGVDFLIGGSPCTYWSIAQTKNRETVASGIGWELFSQYVRALREAEPHYFLYENNKSMSAAIRASITETFGFRPICINSALVSAQNRQRLYWCGVRQADGSYRKAYIDQPVDRGILLKDILEMGTVAEPIVIRQTGRNPDNPKSRVAGLPTMQMFEARTDRKSGTLTTVQKDNLIAEPLCIPEATTKGYAEIKPGDCVDMAHPNSKTRRGRNMENKSNCLQTTNEFYQYCGTIKVPIYEVCDGKITVKGKEYPIKLADGYYIIRKLTVTECKRLQTVPDWYDFPVSNTQAYKMLGNGWTVEVISHLIRGIINSVSVDKSVIDKNSEEYWRHQELLFEYET